MTADHCAAVPKESLREAVQYLYFDSDSDARSDEYKAARTRHGRGLTSPQTVDPTTHRLPTTITGLIDELRTQQRIGISPRTVQKMDTGE